MVCGYCSSQRLSFQGVHMKDCDDDDDDDDDDIDDDEMNAQHLV